MKIAVRTRGNQSGNKLTTSWGKHPNYQRASPRKAGRSTPARSANSAIRRRPASRTGCRRERREDQGPVYSRRPHGRPRGPVPPPPRPGTRGPTTTDVRLKPAFATAATAGSLVRAAVWTCSFPRCRSPPPPASGGGRCGRGRTQALHAISPRNSLRYAGR